MNKRLNLDKYKSSSLGLVQAVIVVAYIVIFALFVMSAENIIPNPPQILAMTLSLIAFVFSALVCGAAILGYPVTLAIRGKIKRAVEVVAWSAGSLLAIALVMIMITASFV
jgi:hypothetical protein